MNVYREDKWKTGNEDMHGSRPSEANNLRGTYKRWNNAIGSQSR